MKKKLKKIKNSQGYYFEDNKCIMQGRYILIPNYDKNAIIFSFTKNNLINGILIEIDGL